jgi:hypothetical protein
MQTGDRRYVMDLELELVEHAEIIFTTLSSSGRNIFGRMKDRKYMRIHTVLIDEACQVSTSSPPLPRRVLVSVCECEFVCVLVFMCAWSCVCVHVCVGMCQCVGGKYLCVFLSCVSVYICE